MTEERFIDTVLEIGSQMLLCGGEVYRAEEAVTRILKAYGAASVEMFVVSTCIIVTVTDKQGGYITKTKNVHGHETDLDKLDRLNSMCRVICNIRPGRAEVERYFHQILQYKTYPGWLKNIVYLIISAAFSMFFGGSARDAAVSAVLGLLLMALLKICKKLDVNSLFSIALSSYICGLLAQGAMRLGLGEHLDSIIIGNIMLIIPGLAFTNAARDMIGGDIMSGMLRLMDAALTAVAVSVGFAFAVRFGWGM